MKKGEGTAEREGDNQLDKSNLNCIATMSMQPRTDVDLEEIWDLDEEELEQILAEDEELIKLEEEVKKVDPAVIEEMQKQEPLVPTLYQPKPPPRPKRKRRTSKFRWSSSQAADGGQETSQAD